MKLVPLTFDGFEPANTTPVPDVLFDQLLPYLSGAELKVLLYIIRRTLGFKKNTDAISLTQLETGIATRDGKQLDQGCGLHRETICNALASLEQRGCIKSVKDKAAAGDNATAIYSISFKEVVGKSDQGSRKIRPGVVGKIDYGGRKNRLPVVGKSDPQETVLQLDSLQETVLQDSMATSAEDRNDLKAEHEELFEETTDTLEAVERITDKRQAIKTSSGISVDGAATDEGSVPRASDGAPQQQTPSPPTLQASISPTADSPGSARPASGRSEKARIQEIRTLYAGLLGFEPIWSRDESDGAKLLARSGAATDAAITATYEKYQNDKFWGPQMTLKVIAKFLNATVAAGGRASPVRPKQPVTRPTTDEIDITLFCTDPTWCIYQRPGDDQEWVLWHGELMTMDEANDAGYDGGFGLYKQHTYA